MNWTEGNSLSIEQSRIFAKSVEFYLKQQPKGAGLTTAEIAQGMGFTEKQVWLALWAGARDINFVVRSIQRGDVEREENALLCTLPIRERARVFFGTSNQWRMLNTFGDG